MLNISFTIDFIIIFIYSSKNLSFAPSVGCDPSYGFFEKRIFYQAQMGLRGIYIFRKWRDNKNGLFSFQVRSIRTDKFWSRLV